MTGGRERVYPTTTRILVCIFRSHGRLGIEWRGRAQKRREDVVHVDRTAAIAPALTAALQVDRSNERRQQETKEDEDGPAPRGYGLREHFGLPRHVLRSLF